MIVVSVQYIDKPQSTNVFQNGGISVRFQVLAQALAFAETESSVPASYGLASAAALCRVYTNGVMVQAWLDGTNVT